MIGSSGIIRRYAAQRIRLYSTASTTCGISSSSLQQGTRRIDTRGQQHSIVRHNSNNNNTNILGYKNRMMNGSLMMGEKRCLGSLARGNPSGNRKGVFFGEEHEEEPFQVKTNTNDSIGDGKTTKSESKQPEWSRTSSSTTEVMTESIITSGGTTTTTVQHPEQHSQQGKEWEQQMMEVTTNILNSNVGSLPPHSWRDGQSALEWWTRRDYPRHDFRASRQGLENSCQLLERLLEEREHIKQRMKIVGALHVSVMVDQCYSIDATKLLQQIAANWYDPEKGHGHPINTKLRDWMMDIRDRFDGPLAEEMAATLQLEPTTAAANNHPLEIDFIAEMKKVRRAQRKKNPSKATYDAQQQQQQQQQQQDQQNSKQQAVRKNVPSSRAEDILVGDLLVQFVRDWKAAGLDWKDAEEKVKQFSLQQKNKHTKSTTEDQSKLQKASLFVLTAWEEVSKNNPTIAPKQANKLLYDMLSRYVKEGNRISKPSRQCFSSVISAHTNGGNPEAADLVLQDMIQLFKETGDNDFLPDRPCFLSILMSYAVKHQANNNEMKTKADRVLQQMLELASSTENASQLMTLAHFNVETVAGSSIEPNKQSKEHLKTNNDVMTFLDRFVQEWRAAGLDGTVAQQKVDDFLAKCSSSDPGYTVTNIKASEAFLLVLKAWEEASKANPSVSKNANNILYEMVTLYLEAGNQGAKPVRTCFLSALIAHTTNKDAPGANKILQDMLRLYKGTGDSDFMPDKQCFKAVISCLLTRERSNKDMIYLADNIFGQMLDLACSTKDPSLIPSTNMVNHLLEVWAESYEKDAGERSEVILLRLQEICDMHPRQRALKVPYEFFQLTMRSWAHSDNPKAVARIKNILSFVNENSATIGDGVPSPTLGCLPLLDALSRSATGNRQERVHEAERVFDQLRVHFGSKYMSCLDIIVAYKAKMFAYRLLRDASLAARKSQSTFDELIELRKNGTITVDPDSTVYGAVAHALARAGEASKVMGIIKQMNEASRLEPDTMMMNYLLLALSRGNDPTAGEQAEEILSHMEQSYRRGNLSLKPHKHTYVNVMTCLARSRDAEVAARTEMYLVKLKELHKKTGDENFRPNAKTYTTVMSALARRKDPSNADKAQAILDEMNQRADTRPDSQAYTIFLKVLRISDPPDKVARAAACISSIDLNRIKPDLGLKEEAKKFGFSL